MWLKNKSDVQRKRWTLLRVRKYGVGKMPCIAHMRIFECFAYTMVLDEKNG